LGNTLKTSQIHKTCQAGKKLSCPFQADFKDMLDSNELRRCLPDAEAHLLGLFGGVMENLMEENQQTGKRLNSKAPCGRLSEQILTRSVLKITSINLA